MSYQPGGDFVAIDHEALDGLANTARYSASDQGPLVGDQPLPSVRSARTDTGQVGLLRVAPPRAEPPDSP